MSISVLYVLANLDVGGAERHIAQIIPKLNPSIVKPTLFTLIYKGVLSAEIENKGVIIIGSGDEYNWRNMSKLKRVLHMFHSLKELFFLLRRNRPDVVHFFLPMPYLLGGIVSLLAGVNFCVMSRRSLNYYQRHYFGAARIERWLHKRMVRILGNSQAVLDDLRNEGVSEHKLGLIYNGVDIPVTIDKCERDDLRQKIGIESEDLVIIIVANLIPYKGHKDLLYGLAKTSMLLPENWKLVCVGHDGHGIMADLVKLSIALGITEHVEFIGGRSDVSDLLQVSDVAVLCSHEEGFSNAVLEGMAAGLPSVVTDVGGNAEAIRDGVDGYVIPANNPEILGKKIADLLCDEKLRKMMGGSARLRAQTSFSVESCVQAYEKMYQKITSKKSQNKN